MSAILLTARHTGDDTVTLTWVHDRALALVAAHLLTRYPAIAQAYQPPVRSDADPLVTLEEGLVADQITASATEHAQHARDTAVRTLTDLAGRGTATVTVDDLWALATATNGAYVHYRRDDLERDGVDLTPGARSALDVDAALAGLLGDPTGTTDEPRTAWSAEAALFATLSTDVLDVFAPDTR